MSEQFYQPFDSAGNKYGEDKPLPPAKEIIKRIREEQATPGEKITSIMVSRMGAEQTPTPDDKQTITFYADGATEIARLDFSTGKMIFTGNADEAAKLFISTLAGQLEPMFAYARRSGAMEATETVRAELRELFDGNTGEGFWEYYEEVIELRLVRLKEATNGK